MSAWADRLLAILNGAVGDNLASAESRLAMNAGFIVNGKTLKTAQLEPCTEVVIFVHGLMGTERDWIARTPRPISDDSEPPENPGVCFGPGLLQEFKLSPLYFRYNTGQQIDVSAAELAAKITQLHLEHHITLRTIVLVGHSMGGRVVRGALHIAYKDRLPWASLVSHVAYLGSPLRGSPLEVVGERATDWMQQHSWPTVRQVGDLANLRSRGIKDLGFARSGEPSSSFRAVRDRPDEKSCIDQRVMSLQTSDSGVHPRQLFVAGKLWSHWMFNGIGDSLVPVRSALDYGGDATAHRVVIDGILHVRMTTDQRVYNHLATWLRTTQ